MKQGLRKKGSGSTRASLREFKRSSRALCDALPASRLALACRRARVVKPPRALAFALESGRCLISRPLARERSSASAARDTWLLVSLTIAPTSTSIACCIVCTMSNFSEEWNFRRKKFESNRSLKPTVAAGARSPLPPSLVGSDTAIAARVVRVISRFLGDPCENTRLRFSIWTLQASATQLRGQFST